MKILLTGASGQVGFELRRSLAPIGDTFVPSRHELDLANEASIRQVVRRIKPDLIINPAAYTAVDKAESHRDLAFAINADAPRILGEEALKLNAAVIHFSTDYVFDGRKEGAYSDLDATTPSSVYGASKLAGEVKLQAATYKHLILRTSWVVGAHGNNFAKTMLRLASERDSLGVVSDQVGSPTSAALLADLTALLVRQQLKMADDFPYGLYHATASGITNWHNYACYVIERARAAGYPIKVSPDDIKAIRTEDYPTPAARPANSHLDTSKFQKTFGLRLPKWNHGVDHILDQIL